MAIETHDSSSEDRVDRLEGMIIAHRKILAQLVAAALETNPGLAERLDDRSVLKDGQEDPGAVPTDGVATGLAIAEETSRLMSMARAERQQEPE